MNYRLSDKSTGTDLKDLDIAPTFTIEHLLTITAYPVTQYSTAKF